MSHNGGIDIPIYDSKYNGFLFEQHGVYLTEHDAFALPPVDKADFKSDLMGGGARLYTMLKEKTIKLTLKVANDRLSPTLPDAGLYEVMQVLYQTEPKPLVVGERPDRYINCLLNGSIEVKDHPGYTELNVPLLANDPLFYSFDEFQRTFQAGIDNPLVMEGNAPHFPEIEVSGIANSPTLTVTNDLGEFTLRYSGTIGASDKWQIHTRDYRTNLNTGPSDYRCVKDHLVIAPGLNKFRLSQGTMTIKYRWSFY